MNILVKVDTSAGDARMHRNAAVRFNQLRREVLAASGVDFLAKCGDVLRPADYVSDKDGVANRSWHKTGRAFDYDQECRALVIVSEASGGRQFFRTYLKCADQSGKLGVKKTLKDYRGSTVTAYVTDFTALAEALGFKRIPAWSGWQKHYNRQEFWHYQFDEGLSWAAAMAQLKAGFMQPIVNGERTIIGLNDRGEIVEKIQNALRIKIDGVFGAETLAAVKEFQRAAGIGVDGLVGSETLKALGISEKSAYAN